MAYNKSMMGNDDLMNGPGALPEGQQMMLESGHQKAALGANIYNPDTQTATTFGFFKKGRRKRAWDQQQKETLMARSSQSQSDIMAQHAQNIILDPNNNIAGSASAKEGGNLVDIRDGADTGNISENKDKAIPAMSSNGPVTVHGGEYVIKAEVLQQIEALFAEKKFEQAGIILYKEMQRTAKRDGGDMVESAKGGGELGSNKSGLSQNQSFKKSYDKLNEELKQATESGAKESRIKYLQVQKALADNMMKYGMQNDPSNDFSKGFNDPSLLGKVGKLAKSEIAKRELSRNVEAAKTKAYNSTEEKINFEKGVKTKTAELVAKGLNEKYQSKTNAEQSAADFKVGVASRTAEIVGERLRDNYQKNADGKAKQDALNAETKKVIDNAKVTTPTKTDNFKVNLGGAGNNNTTTPKTTTATAPKTTTKAKGASTETKSTATVGGSSSNKSSIKAEQEAINAENAGKEGYVPLVIDGIVGPKTIAARGFADKFSDENSQNPNYPYAPTEPFNPMGYSNRLNPFGKLPPPQPPPDGGNGGGGSPPINPPNPPKPPIPPVPPVPTVPPTENPLVPPTEDDNGMQEMIDKTYNKNQRNLLAKDAINLASMWANSRKEHVPPPDQESNMYIPTISDWYAKKVLGEADIARTSQKYLAESEGANRTDVGNAASMAAEFTARQSLNSEISEGRTNEKNQNIQGLVNTFNANKDIKFENLMRKRQAASAFNAAKNQAMSHGIQNFATNLDNKNVNKTDALNASIEANAYDKMAQISAAEQDHIAGKTTTKKITDTDFGKLNVNTSGQLDMFKQFRKMMTKPKKQIQ